MVINITGTFPGRILSHCVEGGISSALFENIIRLEKTDNSMVWEQGAQRLSGTPFFYGCFRRKWEKEPSPIGTLPFFYPFAISSWIFLSSSGIRICWGQCFIHLPQFTHSSGPVSAGRLLIFLRNAFLSPWSLYSL